MNRLLHVCAFTFLMLTTVTIHYSAWAFSEVVIVHADHAWQMTDIILKKNHIIAWKVREDDYWSFNISMFPDGHDANGIPVPALDSYTLPGENIGMLLGKMDDNRIISMGLSGSAVVLPGEEGNYLYLSMNDDLIGKYGEGFQDNNDEIMVTITQTPREVFNITVLFIENCPGILSVTNDIKEILAEESVNAEINFILVDTSEDARRLHFTGSPTVRINGIDIEPNVQANKDYGLRSRSYKINGKKSDSPSKGMIRDAISKITHK